MAFREGLVLTMSPGTMSRRGLSPHAITNDSRFHGNITLQASNNIGGLLLLVPTDNGVEHKNTNDDAEIDQSRRPAARITATPSLFQN